METVRSNFFSAFGLVIFFSQVAFAILNATDTQTRLTISNSRLFVSLNKSIGVIDQLSLDGQDLLGDNLYQAPTPGGSTGNGRSGIGPYLDCNCVREDNGFYTPGKNKPAFKLIRGTEEGNKSFAGFAMRDINPKSGQLMEFYTFLRDGETGLHTFSRVAYKNTTGPTRNILQELRTLFRPNHAMWTHLATNDRTVSPLPKAETLKKAPFAQDATYDLTRFKDDPYVQQTSDYFSKYSFADTWKDHTAHGLYSDGTAMNPSESTKWNIWKNTTSNDTWGAWLVMWNKETYYGGPYKSELTVDGIVYDYMVSNHYGANVPNITVGFDRTFGPNYYYFNHHPPNTALSELYNEAQAYVPPTSFLNALASHVPNYIAPSKRATFRGSITLPKQAQNAILVLSASGMDVQDNAASPTTPQYWQKIEGNQITMKNIVPGTYRATIYADGVFGSWVKDNVVVAQGRASPFPFGAVWTEESAGVELWRIGTPDHSAGEFRHGYARDTTHPMGLEEYRVYHGTYNFWRDFPDGVAYRIGTSVPETDWNYVQWSSANSSTWTVLWTQDQVASRRPAARVVDAAEPRVVAVAPPQSSVHKRPPPSSTHSRPQPSSTHSRPQPSSTHTRPSPSPVHARSPPSRALPPGLDALRAVADEPAPAPPAGSGVGWGPPRSPPVPSSAPPVLPGRRPDSPSSGPSSRNAGNRTPIGKVVHHPDSVGNERGTDAPATPPRAITGAAAAAKRDGEGGSGSRERRRRWPRPQPQFADGRQNDDGDDYPDDMPVATDENGVPVMKRATLTVQAAGVRTTVGNEHVLTGRKVDRFANLNITANVNGRSIGVWTVPWYHSSSCAVRSGVTCYNTRHKFVFDASIIKAGENVLTLNLPPGANGFEGTAKLPSQVYVQYDALRLEMEP